MKKKDPARNSIHDLARQLHLSPATISRVLNHHPHVHEDTRSKVLAMVEKLGYKRNAMASGLRSNRTNTVGLIVPRLSMYFHAEIITTIQNELHTHGYNLIICQSNDSVDLEKELTRTLYASCVDAVIAACTLFTTSLSHFDVLTQNNIPVVFYDRVPVQPYPACMIKGDDFHGGRLAAEHLLAQGCRQIAYISGPLNCSLYIDRFAGFQKAMQEQGVVLPDSRVFHHELSADNARRTMTTLFAQKPWPDAIFAGNDVSALEVLRFAGEHGVSVPTELKVMGYSNDPRSSIVTPSMTTIEQFPANIGKVVVAQLLKLLRPAPREATVSAPTRNAASTTRTASTSPAAFTPGPATSPTAIFPQIVTPVELIVRKSTRRPGRPDEKL